MSNTETYYLIWSNKHSAWWGPHARGYTTHLRRAGRYSRENALLICRGAIPMAGHIHAIAEIPVRLEDVEEFLKDAMIPEGVL